MSKLKFLRKKNSGRDSSGQVTVRHQGGEHKRFMRVIDFKRNKFGIEGRVSAIEYDPNRTTQIALIHYADGDKMYILSPLGLKVGDVVKISGHDSEFKQTITSLQVEHAQVKEITAGESGALKTDKPVKEGDVIYLVTKK